MGYSLETPRYVALHVGIEKGKVYPHELVFLGEHLKDLFAGKDEQQKAALFKKLDAVFKRAEEHERKSGSFIAYKYLYDRTISERMLNETFADSVKQKVRRGLQKLTPRRFR